MILGINGIIATSRGVSDADAQAFITAANITDSTQKNTINQLVLDLKAANIWTKMKAIYPFVGGTASQHRFNLKDPRPVAGAYYLTFYGGGTHSANGYQPDGATAYADTQLNEDIVMTLGNEHISYYSRTNISGLYLDMGVWTDSPLYGTQILSRYVYPSSDSFIGYVTDSSNSYISNSDSRGFFMNNRTSTTQLKLQKNSTINTFSSNVSNKSNLKFYIGARNNTGGNLLYSPRECAFASIGDGLSDSEATAFYNAVQTFNTTLGRQM